MHLFSGLKTSPKKNLNDIPSDNISKSPNIIRTSLQNIIIMDSEDSSSLKDSSHITLNRRSELCQSSSDFAEGQLPLKRLVQSNNSNDVDSEDEQDRSAQLSPAVSPSAVLSSSQIFARTSLVEEFRCAISHQIMRDPVFTSDGETYEREEIERWLAKNMTSPSTNMKLTDKVLKPNIALKKAINTFLEQHPEFVDEVYFSKSLENSFVEACKTSGADAQKETEGTREVKKLITAEKRFLSHRFDAGGSILHIAAQFSSFETLRSIIKCWKSLQKGRPHPVKVRDALIEQDLFGWTPLHYAAHINADYDVVREIIKRVGDTNLEKVHPLNDKQKKGKEIEGTLDNHFLQAAKEETVELMDTFLRLGANLEARDTNSKYKGGTALHIACSKGSPKVAEFLLNKGASVHSRTGTHPCDFSAVHFAARGGHHEVLELLLGKDAEIDMKCNPNGCRDWTALHLAARNGRPTTVELLIKKGANVNAPADEERMGPGTFGPAYLAVYYGHITEAEMLFNAGAKIEGGVDELYPLHGATRNNQVETVKFLLNRGANVNSQDSSKQTALHHASSLGNLDVAKLLVNFYYEEQLQARQFNPEDFAKKAVDLNLEDKKGSTPLHEAVHAGHKDIILYLLSMGANAKCKNMVGRTPIDEANRMNKKDLAEEMLHEIRRQKSLRIQQQKPLMFRLQRQEAQLAAQAELIKKQEEDLKSQSKVIELMTSQIQDILKLLNNK